MRISIHEDDSGYHNGAAEHAAVYLDGEPFTGWLMADEERGEILACRRLPDGRFLQRAPNRLPETEMRRGRVLIVVPPAVRQEIGIRQQ